MIEPGKNWSLITRYTDIYGSQVNYAKKLGVSRALVSLVSNGRYNLESSERYRWAKAFGAHPDDIFKSACAEQNA